MRTSPGAGPRDSHEVSAPARRALFEIEREQRWRIWLLFSLLVALVFVGVWAACLIVSLGLAVFLPGVDTWSWLFALDGSAAVLGGALAAATVYWFASRVGARRRLLRALHCRPLDLGDRYHRRLANVVEEMRLATGATTIECYTVDALGLNAFAFSDLRGGGVVGVTEGALARLSRQQLEAIVAHEFGHILSGSYVTATVACLLFGIYSEVGERLEEAALAGRSGGTASLSLAVLGLRAWLWLLQLASSITGAALSRERERQADLAAARYLRDPLSLAEALRIVSRHPAGAGYIPEGLTPLCIRAVSGREPWLLTRLQRTHLPLDERIGMLLTLANVSPAEFEGQAERAVDNLKGHEHWASPPTAALAAAPPGLRPAAPDGAPGTCPGCGAGLLAADYEGMHIRVCPSCGGRLAGSADVSRMLARREVGFSSDQERLADLVAEAGDERRRAARRSRDPGVVRLVACPGCGSTMMRRHFSYEHAIEVDYCSICNLFWFERDELEALQILAERQSG